MEGGGLRWLGSDVVVVFDVRYGPRLRLLVVLFFLLAFYANSCHYACFESRAERQERASQMYLYPSYDTFSILSTRRTIYEVYNVLLVTTSPFMQII